MPSSAATAINTSTTDRRGDRRTVCVGSVCRYPTARNTRWSKSWLTVNSREAARTRSAMPIIESHGPL
jgi:hypothetical protein